MSSFRVLTRALSWLFASDPKRVQSSLALRSKSLILGRSSSLAGVPLRGPWSSSESFTARLWFKQIIENRLRENIHTRLCVSSNPTFSCLGQCIADSVIGLGPVYIHFMSVVSLTLYKTIISVYGRRGGEGHTVPSPSKAIGRSRAAALLSTSWSADKALPLV